MHIIKYIIGLVLIYLAVTVGGEPVRQIIIAAIGLAILFNGAEQAERRLEK